MNIQGRFFILAAFCCLMLTACESDQSNPGADDFHFTIAVIPDTQNMVNFTHQKDEGFALNGGDMFLEQMQYLADNGLMNGGEIVFVTSVGDVKQNTDNKVDPAHYSRGLRALKSKMPFMATDRMIERIKGFELPLVRRGYDILADRGMVFSVVPGNQDYDNVWMDSQYIPDFSRIDELKDSSGKIIRYDPEILGMYHLGGLEDFNSVFSSQGKYFKDKEWYISSFSDGANSAQVFTAGGYKFLHIGLEMHPGDKILAWAQSVISQNPGLPTIISTHDFLNSKNERLQLPVLDLAGIDPTVHNNAEDIWKEFISINDQIFLVLSGHYYGQGYLKSHNQSGHEVYQILSNYQGRGQAASPLEGQPVAGIGDGWLRLMKFNTGSDVPSVQIRTYSTYFKIFSIDMPSYAVWYKSVEQPNMSDEEFIQADHFTITLSDFQKRFGVPQEGLRN